MSFDPKYKEVFRDVGVLEVLTNCLKQYSTELKDTYDSKLKCEGENRHLSHT